MAKQQQQRDNQDIATSSQIQSINSLSFFEETSGAKQTLKTIIENDKEGGEKSYHMMCPESKVAYEVKTKNIRITSTKVNKIVVVKDQTVYEQLVKQNVLEKYQRMLLSSISHEIRNPLNALSCYITTIMESISLGEIKNLCQKIAYSLEHINLIVCGACHLMYPENKTLLIEEENFDLMKKIKEIIDIITPTIEAKQLFNF